MISNKFSSDKYLAHVLYQLKFPIDTYGDSRQFENFTDGPFICIGFKGDKEGIGKKARFSLFKSRKKILKLIDEFYKTRVLNDSGGRLVLKIIGMWGSFFIINQDTEILDLLPIAKRKNKLRQHRKEFRQFADFLIKKYRFNK